MWVSHPLQASQLGQLSPCFFVYLVIFIFILFLTISVGTNISTSTEPIITNFAGLVELSIPLRLQV